MAKDLPIQIVELRQNQDEFKPEGISDKCLPKWATDEAVLHNGAMVYNQLNCFEDLFNSRSCPNVPIVIEAKINKEATAKTHRAGICSMFDVSRKRNVIGMTSFDKVLIKIDNVTDLNSIKRNFSKYKNLVIKNEEKKSLAAVESISKFVAQKDENLVGDEIKVRLVDFGEENLNNSFEEYFVDFCNKNGVEENKLDYSRKLYLYSINNASHEFIEKLSTMDGILSIRQMPHYIITSSEDLVDNDLDIKEPEEKTEYPIVGLLDSGIEPIEHLKRWILSDDSCPFVESDVDKRHGTLVAGVLLYGDELFKKKITGGLPCKILDCVVNTTTFCVHEDELVEHIKEYIDKYPDIKVWNLSQGCNIPISNNHFSEFAIALDELQRENDIIICKSAGNGNPSNPCRITEGADSIYSLVVGSISHDKITDRDGSINCRSPFSLLGPGPQSLIKPDLTQYGGNADTGIKSFSIYGNVAITSGTSFSTPRISSLAASLSFLLADKYSPLLVKAMIIHSATYPLEMSTDSRQRLLEVGYGLPSTCMDILHNDKDECTMVFDLKFTNKYGYQVVDFPFPESMVDENGYYYGDITITLATEPIVNVNEAVEYCQSEVDIKLETFDRIEVVQPGEPGVSKTIRNKDRLKETNNVLCSSNYNAKARKNQSDNFVQERTLVSEYFKFQPIKKYHVSLEDMTKGNKEKMLKSDKRWVIKMKALYREALMAKKTLDPEVSLVQKVVLIVTIRDSKKQGVAYDQCIQKLNVANFVHNNLQVTQNVQIENK